ncbi:MAG: sigma-70 family RNA polymerase sigma factor [Clostridia bacterium]|nr:sigma-70 family RNA polymerase sigma factor [Clostridia bacterium]
MSIKITKETFEEMYQNTYNNILRYIICHCNDLDDVNDIIQDTYADLYKTICRKKEITLENVESYLIGITKNKIKKNYKDKVIIPIDDEIENIKDDSLDIEINIITKENVLKVWNYLKLKSDLTANIFYLYYVMELPIKVIAKELKMTESNVKNYLYRTKKELQETFMEGGNIDAK